MKLIETGLPGTRRITEKQQRLVECARREHRARARRAIAIRAVLGAAVALIVAASVLAFYQRRKAVQEMDIANLHHQFEVIIDELSTDPYMGLAYAVSSAYHSLNHPAVKRVMSELQYALSQAVLEGRELNMVNRNSPMTALDLGAQMVVAGRIDGRLQLHSLDGNLSRSEFDAHKAPVTGVAASPDGNWFASAAKDGYVKLWRRDGAPDHDLLYLPPGEVEGGTKPRYATAIAAAADGASVVSGWNDGALRILPVYGNSAPIEVRFPHTGGTVPQITAVATKRARDRGLVVLVGFSNGELALWSLTEHKSVYAPWRAHPDKVLAVDLNTQQAYSASRDSSQEVRMVSASQSGVVKIWNGRNALLNEPLQFHTAVNTVRFNAFGNLLVFATQAGQVHVTDLEGRAYFPPFHGFASAVSVALFDTESLHVFAASQDGSVRVLDLAGQPIRFPAINEHKRVTALVFHPNGNWLAGATEKHIYVWAVDSASATQPLTLVETLALDPKDPGDSTHALAIDPAGKTLVIGGAGWIRLWSFDDHRLSDAYPVHCTMVDALAFDPGGDLLAIGGDNTDVVDLWNTKQQRIAGGFPSLHRTVRALLFSGDGRYLFTGGDDMRARRWDLRTPGFWTSPLELRDAAGVNVFHGGVYAMAFTPDQHTLIVGDASGNVVRWRDGTRFWDMFKAHTGPVQAIQVHPMGEAMYSVSDTGQLREDSLRTTETVAVPMQRQGAGMFSLALSPDGHVMASGAGDGAVQLWRSHWNAKAELACERLLRHPRFRLPAGDALQPVLEDVNKACSTQFWKSPEALEHFQLAYPKER